MIKLRNIFLASASIVVTAALAQAQPSACENKCTSRDGDCYELASENPRLYSQCVSQCKLKCASSPPPPVVLHLKFMVLGIIYAPPGCTSSASAPCRDESTVDYAGGSSMGSKVSGKHSFKLDAKESVDLGGIVGASGGYTFSQSGSDSYSVTKTASLEIKGSGNSDGVDHGQDIFILALKPTVTVREQNENLYWRLGHDEPSLVLYEVYASELRDPTSMRPAVASEFATIGLTTKDYQAILSLDPFGGTVASPSGGRHGVATFPEGPGTHFTVSTGYSGPALDSGRFRVTTFELPYEPPLQSSNCNGGVCTCLPMTTLLKNEFVTDKTSEHETDYSVGINSGFGSWLKASETFTWTNSATTNSTIDSSQSASATVVCPSVNYKGPFHIQVYWDSLFGTFLFIPSNLSAASIVQRGNVKDASGKAVVGQRVDLSYGGKTYHTLTSQNGSYTFFGTSPHGIAPQSATLTVGKVRKHLQLGSRQPTMIQMR
jgi:hypothetical protein